MLSTLFMLCVLVGVGVGPLPADKALQARSFVVGNHPDQAALYALLADAATWEAGDEAGAVVPDWNAIREDPARWRGRALLIEGVDAGRRRRIELVRPQMPWGDAVTEWGVVVEAGEPTATQGQDNLPTQAATHRADASEATTTGNIAKSQSVAEFAERGLPVVVWFFDPGDAIGESVHGRRVRLVGRFLGWWNDQDASGAARSYPVVVARHAAVVPGSANAGRGGFVGGWPGMVLAGAVLSGLWLWWRVVRKAGRLGVVAGRRAARRARGTQEENEAEEVPEDLPADAAEALDVLGRGPTD